MDNDTKIELAKYMVNNMINSLEQHDNVDQTIIKIGLKSIKRVLDE
jgi:hypothetical protein